MTAEDFLASTTRLTLVGRFRQEWEDNEHRRRANRRDPALLSVREEFECQITSNELTRAIVLVLASVEPENLSLSTHRLLDDLVKMARIVCSSTSANVSASPGVADDQVDGLDQREEVGGCAGCGAKFFDMITALEHDCDGTL